MWNEDTLTCWGIISAGSGSCFGIKGVLVSVCNPSTDQSRLSWFWFSCKSHNRSVVVWHLQVCWKHRLQLHSRCSTKRRPVQRERKSLPFMCVILISAVHHWNIGCFLPEEKSSSVKSWTGWFRVSLQNVAAQNSFSFCPRCVKPRKDFWARLPAAQSLNLKRRFP